MSNLTWIGVTLFLCGSLMLLWSAVRIVAIAWSGKSEEPRPSVRVKGITACLFVGLVMLGIAPWFALTNRSDQRTGLACLSNIKQVGLALLVYANDYDDVLPPASTWTSQITPISKSREVLRCPHEPELVRYGLNTHLSGKNVFTMSNADRTVMLAELKASNPSPTFTDTSGWVFAHNDRMGLGCVDGHALMVGANRVLGLGLVLNPAKPTVTAGPIVLSAQPTIGPGREILRSFHSANLARIFGFPSCATIVLGIVVRAVVRPRSRDLPDHHLRIVERVGVVLIWGGVLMLLVYVIISPVFPDS